MPLNPQGAPKPHERLEATADDVLAEIETTCCEIAEKIHNHAMFVLYELVEELEEQARTMREFRKRMGNEELDSWGDALKDFIKEEN